jgi:hypothetical protein
MLIHRLMDKDAPTKQLPSARIVSRDHHRCSTTLYTGPLPRLVVPIARAAIRAYWWRWRRLHRQEATSISAAPQGSNRVLTDEEAMLFEDFIIARAAFYAGWTPDNTGRG